MSTDNIARIGVNAVARVFLDYGWIFREQHESDNGVDAQVEIVRDNIATGRLIALQIKSGTSYFRLRGDDYVYHGSLRHLEYWSNHSLPVFLILFNPETGETVWVRINPDEVERSDTGWSITIPRLNILNPEAMPTFEQSTARETDAERAQDVEREVDSGDEILLEALDQLSQVDKEMRIRILGFSLWYQPMQKSEINERLAKYGAQATIDSNCQRLCSDSLLRDTGTHYLPNVEDERARKICEQAMSHVMPEIIEFLESGE